MTITHLYAFQMTCVLPFAAIFVMLFYGAWTCSYSWGKMFFLCFVEFLLVALCWVGTLAALAAFPDLREDHLAPIHASF